MNLYEILFTLSLLKYACGIIVQTKSGPVQGVLVDGDKYNKYNSFTGIPFAKAPVGKLRFEPPVPIEPWNNTIQATKPEGKCPQIDDSTFEYNGEEDCLFVNIFTPQNATRGDKIPTIVLFFGGIYKFGSTGKFGGQLIMRRRVIFTSVSFRLGVLGLFSTGDSLIPGNMALKDQSLAMKWIKDNIDAFGGDPDRITIMGHSSGGSFTHFHTLSPMSKGLFRRAIMQSGVANSIQSFNNKETNKNLSALFSKEAGCGSNLTVEAIECLRGKDAEDLVTLADNIYLWRNMYPEMLFKPTVEDKSVKNPFLSEVPVVAQHPSTDFQMLIGMTSGEGAYIAHQLLSPVKGLDMDPKLLLPITFYHQWQSKPNYLNFISKSIMTHFFGEEKIGPSTDVILAQALTGAMYAKGLIDAVEKFNGTRYVYYFDYDLKNVTCQFDYGNYSKYLGIAHADELTLIFFKSPKLLDTLTETDRAVSNEILKRWTNFVYSGDPNMPEPINTSIFSQWEPVKSRNLEFLHMKLKGKMRSKFFREKYSFWNKLPLFSNYF